jgi:hypothetical protein
MELINATRMTAGYNMGLEPSGRELLVVVIKGTFVLPAQGEPVRLHEQQLPLVLADTFSGEPGFSAPLHEVDFAPRKPACDVLLNGSAYAPPGRAVTRTRVGLQLGPISKFFDVVGPRVWLAQAGTVHASQPQPFARLPLSYDVAFGGLDNESPDPADHDAYAANPAGQGFRRQLKSANLHGRPLPNTEVPGQPVSSPTGAYAPMAFGPLGRGWPQRARYAGTYDQTWLDDHFPFLPPDFDERYYQAAPADQQMPHPQQPLPVRLTNLTPDGLREFTLPYFEAPIHVFPKRGPREDFVARLDTIHFEPDLDRFTMSWRIARPLKKNLHEIAQVLVGRKGPEWWQQREKVAFPIPVVMVPMDRTEAAS